MLLRTSLIVLMSVATLSVLNLTTPQPSQPSPCQSAHVTVKQILKYA